MDDVFIIHACEILGDTYSGLSGSEIVKYCVKYAVQYGVNVPHSIYPFKEFAKEVPNKRTALRNNILAFNKEQQYIIIQQLCELPKFNKNNNVQELKKKLIKCDNQVINKPINLDTLQNEAKITKKITDITYRDIIDVFNFGIDEENINRTNCCVDIRQDKGEVTMIEDKIFISHSSVDKEFGQALVDLLRGMGLKREQIVFTSNTNYGIPLDNNIFDYLKSQIENKVYMLYLLSDSYYSSVACLNEMGAAWMVQNNYTTIFVPDFNFQNPKFYEGAIDPRKIGFVIDEKQRILEFKNNITAKFNLSIDEFDWSEAFDKYIKEVRRIKAEKIKSRASESEIACSLETVEEKQNKYSSDINILNKDENGFYTATIIEDRPLINSKGIKFNCYKLNGIIGEVKVEPGESHWLLYKKDIFGDFMINDKIKFKIQRIDEVKSYNKGEKTRNIYVLDLYKI
ncbi:toll/interleukin-1 receptor domain-containing protein [Clostridium beijerinckii]|uniref:toll/interleukin-1 receptor domain-containing protein n=1 Tax=Clostridium beijerinckii TaxID=1520 RepID=UPI00098C62B7|nr:toll/interleukin-1 receptor domain-containing protein [Clostridium beijerinckii]NRU38930.1 hypothetical protein [Clostridium beijerinckii]NSA97791.1 hypothetical protein [Clostridium beijerinckii]OOM68673.1 hypothetical protein CLOBI_02280 [Clostridium beijerinckii]OOM72618.1 hypothetical protein CLBEIC_06270 [Clostridium beijerinckii]CUU48421.1 protein of unknown function [Clostridium beijerinckii]